MVKKNKLPSAPPYPVRVNAVTYLKVKAIAEAESRSMNKQIELAINQMIAAYEALHGSIEVDPTDLDE